MAQSTLPYSVALFVLCTACVLLWHCLGVHEMLILTRVLCSDRTSHHCRAPRRIRSSDQMQKFIDSISLSRRTSLRSQVALTLFVYAASRVLLTMKSGVSQPARFNFALSFLLLVAGRLEKVGNSLQRWERTYTSTQRMFNFIIVLANAHGESTMYKVTISPTIC